MGGPRCDDLLTIRQAATEIGVPENQVYRAINAGRLAAVKHVGRMYISREAIFRAYPPDPGLPERAWSDRDDYDLTKVPTPGQRGLPYALVVWPDPKGQTSARWTYHPTPESAKAHAPQHDRWTIVDVTRSERTFPNGDSHDAWVRKVRSDLDPNPRRTEPDEGKADAR